jgi:glucose/arabinose dehydrogenase
MRRKVLVGIIFVASLAVLAPSLPPGGTFFDDDGSIHEGDIEAIAAAAITKGCNPPVNNQYCPTDFVTREQMASFIARAEELSDTGPGDWFIDDDTSIHRLDIDRIATAGITKGCNPPDNDEFCPADFVTREQMASFMARARGLTDTGSGDYFIDDDTSIHQTDIDRIATIGITKGCNPPDNDRYCPTDYVTREQMASFMSRAYELSATKPDPRLTPELTTVATGFTEPIYATALPGDDRIFIVERDGIIKIHDGATVLATPFLDITDAVTSSPGELGLSGFAFHPDYDTNGRFFVYYTTNDTGCSNYESIVAEYGVSDGDEDVADATETRILTFCQPTTLHNSGMLAFGPNGNLFIASGDGGGAFDSNQNAQNNDTLLGAMLRISVDGALPYAVPADNPFVGIDGADEIFAMGLRNAWRFSIDGDTIYLGDVGQNTREEIDVFSATEPGLNFGWPRYEGNLCVKFGGETTCDSSGLTFPVIEIAAPASDSITGGYVYRGSLGGFEGHYFYGDFSDGYIKSALIIDGVAYDQRDWTSELGQMIGLVSFGVDGAEELLLVNYITGTIYRLDGV